MIPAESLPQKSRVAALLDHFAAVEDPRDVRRITHRLDEILLRVVCRHGLIRTWEVTDASSHDGRMLRHGLLDASNTAATVWADSAYRSKRSIKSRRKIGGWAPE